MCARIEVFNAGYIKARTAQWVYAAEQLIFRRFGSVGLYVFAVDPIENCQYGSVELRIQITVARGLYMAYEIYALAAEIVHNWQAASQQAPVSGNIVKLYKI